MDGERNQEGRLGWWVVPALLTLILLGAGSIPAHASPARVQSACVTCLGPQTNTLWEGYTPLGGFTRYGAPLARNLRIEVLYIGQGDALLWPLVKALDAFGSWRGVQPAQQVCRPAPYYCDIPTFDLSHAIYRSRYAALVTASLASGGHCIQRLPSDVVGVLKHEHWRLWKARFENEPCWNPPAGSGDPVPLLLVGGYLQVGPQVVAPSDFQGPAPGGGSSAPGSSLAPVTGLPFATVHDTLARNEPSALIPPAVLYAVNAEVNLIEALVCHADHLQPRRVCGRGVIGKLIKRMH